MAYPSSIKASNITENWLFELGFYNGDAQGSGDGGFDAVKQADGNPNLVKGAIVSDSATAIDVDDTTVFSVGDFIKIGNEVLLITALTDGDTLAVERGEKGTTASTHSDNTQIYWHNFLPLAFSDYTDNETFYYGVITNKPSIREAIDLKTSTNKTSNISINFANFTYKGNPVYKELISTNYYINRECNVYVVVNGQAKTKIASFRISDISFSNDIVKVSMISHRPWDNITIPQTQTDTTKRYFPVVYGNYTGVASTYASPAYLADLPNTLFPLEVDSYGHHYTCLLHRDIGTSDVKLRYYDEGLDKFIPLDYSDTDGASSYENGFSLKTEWHLKRHFKFKPLIAMERTFGTDVGNVFDDDDADDDSSTKADLAITADASASFITVNKDNLFELPTFDDAPDKTSQSNNHGLTCEVRWEYEKFLATTTSTEGVSNNGFNIQDASDTSSVVSFGTNGSFSNTSATYTTGGGADISAQTASQNLAVNYSATGGFQEGFRLRFNRTANSAGTTTIPGIVSGVGHNILSVYDIRFKATCAIDKLNMSDNSRVTKVKRLYSNADGLFAGITGGTSHSNDIIHEIHDAHLDLLNRFCGINVDTSPATNIDGYNALNSDRYSDWDIRYWKHEPIELKKVLEQMQYEGCFIFRFKQGDFNQPQYIHIPNSISSDLTLNKYDLEKINLQSSSPADIVTKQVINYNIHPARGEYQENVTALNSSSRKNYNIADKENIETINLDMLVGAVGDTDPTNDNRNDSFAGYRHKLFGDLYLKINCDIVNPAKWVDSSLNPIEVGSIIEFDEDNMYPETPIGFNSDDWNGLKFIITSTSRSLGKLSIQARSL